MSARKQNGPEIPSPAPTPIKGAPAAFATTITPEMAIKWLEHNTMNRTISQSSVDNWASVMKRGQWVLNGETIIISDTGEILDGQHRLSACFQSESPFESYVIVGMTKDVFSTIDTGKKRSGYDALTIYNRINKIEGKWEAKTMAAITTVLEYKLGLWKTRHTHLVTNTDKISFLQKYPGIARWVAEAHVKGVGRWENHHSATIGAVAFMGSAQYSEKAKSFVAGFTTGNDLPVGSPVLDLRARLSSVTQMQKWTRMRLIALAWNLHVEGMKRDKLKMPSEMPIIAGTEPPAILKKGAENLPTKKRASSKPRVYLKPKAREAAEIAYITKGR